MWANGATCCEYLKHFYKEASWASSSPAKAEENSEEGATIRCQVSQEGSATQHCLEKGTNGPT